MLKEAMQQSKKGHLKRRDALGVPRAIGRKTCIKQGPEDVKEQP